MRVGVLIALLVGGGVLLGLLATDRPCPSPLDRRVSPQADRSRSARVWTQVQRGLDRILSQPSGVAAFIDSTTNSNDPVIRYQRAILLMGQGRHRQSLDAFNSIPDGYLPVESLYAPFRLWNALRPGEPNPHGERLERAARAGELPALVSARVFAATGQTTLALESYLKSDPAGWTAHDVDCFASMARDAGLLGDVRRVLSGAFRAGRVKPELCSRLRSIAQDSRPPVRAPELDARIRGSLKEDPALAGVVLASVQSLDRDRRLFLEKKFGELLKVRAAAAPNGLANETLLLLFLAAAASREHDRASRYGRELCRRHPAADVQRWVRQVGEQS